MKHLTLLFCIVLFSSCFEDVTIKPGSGDGMRPIYGQIGTDISEPAMGFDDLTNIVVYQELILALEEHVGIHIIDNSDPINPINILFVPMAGVHDLVVKDDILLANTGDLICSIDIKDRTKAILKRTSTVEGVSNAGQNFYPQDYTGLFECVDSDQGIVLKWELILMEDSDCWR